MAPESSLVTHCLVKNSSTFYFTFIMWASQLLGLFSEDFTLADDWALDITDRFTLFVCMEQNTGCADRQEFSFLVQAVFD